MDQSFLGAWENLTELLLFNSLHTSLVLLSAQEVRATSFRRCNNVVDVQTTLYQRQNDVVCFLEVYCDVFITYLLCHVLHCSSASGSVHFLFQLFVLSAPTKRSSLPLSSSLDLSKQQNKKENFLLPMLDIDFQRSLPYGKFNHFFPYHMKFPP